ncbi:hypothetical protein [Aggregatibacter actinomycetemcomitans]|uniref:hypothetical protein n=1 Tax=Aggregatibacter actinomycetemcomitans TaxID=714 RepID=UPI00201CF71A|nr:hypothetical protein [Aggregatibacter actinomycetemcomitans]
MKRLIIKQLAILSKDKDAGNLFTFSDGVNFILSDKNSAGKTTLLNLMYSALGCVVKFKNEWINSFIRLDIAIEGNSYSLYKTPNEIYYIHDEKDLVKYENESDYHKRLSEILGYKIYLKVHSGTPKLARPAHFFLTSYISQAKGWNSFFPNSFEKLGEFRAFQPDLVEQFCKVKSDKELENEEEFNRVKDNLKQKTNEKQVLNLTKENLEKETNFDINKLKENVENYEKSLNLLQDELSNLVVERQFLLNEINFVTPTVKEVDEDYQEARMHGAKIECPYCGTIHSNTITEKLELFFIKTKLEDELINNQSRIKEIDIKISETEINIKELSELKSGIDHLISDNTKHLRKAITANEIFGIISDLENEITQLEKRKKSINKIKNRNRKEYEEHREAVNDFFVTKLKYYADRLSIVFNNYDEIQKVTDYNKVLNAVKGGAADSNRTVLAYYLAIYATAINFNTDILPPLVLDTPNQNEQDKENYKSIIDTLIKENNKQIIICLIRSEYSEKLKPVNKIEVNRLMKMGEYHKFFDELEI